jgi:protein-L-isoaspartate(D-aspartate) O-methyltransferase
MAGLNPDNGKEWIVYARERDEMIERLRKHYRIQNENVLAAMAATPRHLFVPEALRGHAYGDYALPIAHGQTISQPYIVARQTELLEAKKDARILEIGAGSGYQTAILAQVAGRVYALERIPDLARNALSLLRELKIFNAIIKCFDGTFGWNEFAPYHGILVAAAAPEIPQPLVNQLIIGGHLVIPVGSEKEQRLLRVNRTMEGIEVEDFGGCQFVKLIGRYGWEQ